MRAPLKCPPERMLVDLRELTREKKRLNAEGKFRVQTQVALLRYRARYDLDTDEPGSRLASRLEASATAAGVTAAAGMPALRRHSRIK